MSEKTGKNTRALVCLGCGTSDSKDRRYNDLCLEMFFMI